MAKAGVFIVDISALKCGVNGCEICSMRQYKRCLIKQRKPKSFSKS